MRSSYLAAVLASLAAAYLLRFDFSLPRAERPLLLVGLALATPLKMLTFYFSKVDRGLWRYASIADLERILLANTIASLAFVAAGLVLIGPGFPRSVYVIDFVLCFCSVSAVRFSVRFYFEAIHTLAPQTKPRNVLIYGAGAAGVALLREIRSNPGLNYRVLGFLDDDPYKRAASLQGATVLGRGRDAAGIVDRLRKKRVELHEIIIAMPSAGSRRMSEALANCRVAGVPCKTIPSVPEMLTGRVLVSQIREVSVADLLGRESVRLEEDQIRAAIANRVVLVTGAGGSIGSELCRQVLRFGPATLVALDQSEHGLFQLELELNHQSADRKIVMEIGDIRSYARMERTIRHYGVHSVFHAAAYKHVPLMERHILEAVRNNVLGTHNLVKAAHANGVSTFLMISSDKAVNPTNIMGLTKRIAELVVASMPVPEDGGSGTRFVSVRFGNVLGSSGSVVPVFKAQIASGGPVTVTHPEMRRYFMTVPEAVQLVLQASTMGKGSEIFVLDMGEPVRILDLARNMIRLCGYEPDIDIPIRFIGLRPGEKLFEELITRGENIRPTYHEKIMIFCGVRLDQAYVEQWIAELERLAALEDELGVLRHLKELAPEYQPLGRWQTALEARPLRKVATAV